MLAFINKYKRWIYLALFAVVFIIMFFPTQIDYYNISAGGLATSFNSTISAAKIMSSPDYPYDFLSDKEIAFDNSLFVLSIFSNIFIILGLLLCIATILLIKKHVSYALGYLFLSCACIMKMFFQAHFRNSNQGYYIVSYGDAWTDYVIISIALLMLIVDIVRLSIYIRNHREQIAAKLSALKPPPRERKPSKDERIAELEERVRQLEDSKKDG